MRFFLLISFLLIFSHSYVLNLNPAALYVQQAYYNTTLSSWGGSVIMDENGTYHLFASAMVLQCGLDQWQTNSEVIHGTSKSSVGPFIYHDVALPVWHHNPQIVRDISGLYLLYSIGMSPEGTVVNCTPKNAKYTTDKSINTTSAHGAELIEVHTSTSLNGPWTPYSINGDINLFNGTNPAPFILTNGTVVVGSHSGNGFDVGIAPTWKGPYTLYKSLFTWPVNTTGEDPFIWFDYNIKKWRVLFHQYNTSDPHDGSLWVGGYAESETDNVLGACKIQDYHTPAYQLNVTFVDGEKITLYRRERPKLLFDAKQNPLVLYNGACPPNTTSHKSNCFTLSEAIQSINFGV